MCTVVTEAQRHIENTLVLLMRQKFAPESLFIGSNWNLRVRTSHGANPILGLFLNSSSRWTSREGIEAWLGITHASIAIYVNKRTFT